MIYNSGEVIQTAKFCNMTQEWRHKYARYTNNLARLLKYDSNQMTPKAAAFIKYKKIKLIKSWEL